MIKTIDENKKVKEFYFVFTSYEKICPKNNFPWARKKLSLMCTKENNSFIHLKKIKSYYMAQYKFKQFIKFHQSPNETQFGKTNKHGEV